MDKINWTLYFCVSQKAFYRVYGIRVQKVINDEWRDISVDVKDLRFLNLVDLGPF